MGTKQEPRGWEKGLGMVRTQDLGRGRGVHPHPGLPRPRCGGRQRLWSLWLPPCRAARLALACLWGARPCATHLLPLRGMQGAWGALCQNTSPCQTAGPALAPWVPAPWPDAPWLGGAGGPGDCAQAWAELRWGWGGPPGGRKLPCLSLPTAAGALPCPCSAPGPKGRHGLQRRSGPYLAAEAQARPRETSYPPDHSTKNLSHP